MSCASDIVTLSAKRITMNAIEEQEQQIVPPVKRRRSAVVENMDSALDVSPTSSQAIRRVSAPGSKTVQFDLDDTVISKTQNYATPQSILSPFPTERLWYTSSEIEMMHSRAREESLLLRVQKDHREANQQSIQEYEPVNSGELMGLKKAVEKIHRQDMQEFEKSYGKDISPSKMKNIITNSKMFEDDVPSSIPRGLEARVSILRIWCKRQANRMILAYQSKLRKESVKKQSSNTSRSSNLLSTIVEQEGDAFDDATKLSMLARKCNKWACDVARATGIDDFFEAHDAY